MTKIQGLSITLALAASISAIAIAPAVSQKQELRADSSCADGLLKKCREQTSCAQWYNGVCQGYTTLTFYYTMF